MVISNKGYHIYGIHKHIYLCVYLYDAFKIIKQRSCMFLVELEFEIMGFRKPLLKGCVVVQVWKQPVYTTMWWVWCSIAQCIILKKNDNRGLKLILTPYYCVHKWCTWMGCDNWRILVVTLQRTVSDRSRNWRTRLAVKSSAMITWPRSGRSTNCWTATCTRTRRCSRTWPACGTTSTCCGNVTRSRTATGRCTCSIRLCAPRCTWDSGRWTMARWSNSTWWKTWCGRPWCRGCPSCWTPASIACCCTPGSWTLSYRTRAPCAWPSLSSGPAPSASRTPHATFGWSACRTTRPTWPVTRPHTVSWPCCWSGTPDTWCRATSRNGVSISSTGSRLVNPFDRPRLQNNYS